MSSRTVLALVLVAVLGGAAAWLAGGHSETPAAAGVNAPLVPGLAERINDVAAISVQDKDEHFTIRKDGSTWKVVEHGNYPANFELVKKTLMGLGDMKTLEAKTGNPDLYKKIGVEDPEQPGADSALLTVLDAGGQSLGAVILGHTGSQPSTLYARRPSESQSWLVHGDLYLERRSGQWISKDGWKLPAERVKSVLTEHADGEKLLAARDAESEATIALRDIPEGMQVKSSSVGRMQQAALDPLTFEDVAAIDSHPLPANEVCVTTLDTFDGLHVVVTSAREEAAPTPEPSPEGSEAPTPRIWARVEVSAGPDATDAVKAEAEKASADLAPWVFALQEWRAGGLRRRMTDMVQPIPPPKPGETPVEPPAAPDAVPPLGDEQPIGDQPPAEPPPADETPKSDGP